MLGQRFGRLVVVAFSDSKSHHKRWRCRCDCGGETVAWQLSLRRGDAQSCGCLAREKRRERWATYRGPAFWARVRKGGPDECWPWTGAVTTGRKTPSPYGSLGWRGRIERAHRVAYMLTKGDQPAGRMVLHTCDNTLCCNPAHLYVGDHDRNMLDMVERGRRRGSGAGEKNGRAKLTQTQADEIRARYAAGGVSQQALADEYGVSQNAVSKIVRRERYA